MSRFVERARADESGAALVITLVFLAFIGVMAPALLNYSRTSLRATVGLREARAAVTGADSALEGAIHKVRTTRDTSTTIHNETNCFRATMNTVAMRVDCSGTDNLHVTFTTCLQSAATPCPSTDIRGVATVVFANATDTAGVRITAWSVRK